MQSSIKDVQREDSKLLCHEDHRVKFFPSTSILDYLLNWRGNDTIFSSIPSISIFV